MLIKKHPYLTKIIIFCFNFLFLTNIIFAAPPIFRLRLVDAETMKPIPSHSFLLIPRIIMQKSAPDSISPDLNLQFAKSFTTDSNGYYDLPETVITEFTSDGKIYVDSKSDGYARFILHTEYTSKQTASHIVTIFHALPNGKVACVVYLSTECANTLLLEPQRLKAK